MEAVILINLLAVAAVIAVFALPAVNAKRKLEAAQLRLADVRVKGAEHVAKNFAGVRARSAKRALGAYWLVLIAAFVVLFIGFDLYARSVEPRADLSNWLLFGSIWSGLVLLTATFVLAYAVSVAWQTHQAIGYLDRLQRAHPSSAVVGEVRDMIAPRSSEIAMTVIGQVAVVGCILYGLALIALFYAAAQTAIDCARSSKCL